MGAGDDMKKALTKGLSDWTKQRKREEKHAGAVRYRGARLRRARDMFITEAVAQIIEQCYEKVSENSGGRPLPANARQLYYAARPLVAALTDRPFEYSYFAGTILPAYLQDHPAETANWDIVYDDRGHMTEPHGNLRVGLGTLNVRAYLASVKDWKLQPAELASVGVDICGPSGQFGALLYVEKEGFGPLFDRVRLAQRRDIAIMSSKGMSVIAARQLAEGICSRYGIPLLVLHDFDKAGVIIKDTLEHGTWRYSYRRSFEVIDLGLTFDDIDGLEAEDAGGSKITDERLEEAGLDDDAIEFLRTQRVELNAMTSRQLVDFVERKLDEHGIAKVVPPKDKLDSVYRQLVQGKALREQFEAFRKEQKDAPAAEVPADLLGRIQEVFKKHPAYSWFQALQSIADPDAPDAPDEAEAGDEDDDEDDEDLSDIDE